MPVKSDTVSDEPWGSSIIPSKAYLFHDFEVAKDIAKKHFPTLEAEIIETT